MRALLVEDDLDLGASLVHGLKQASWQAVWVRRMRDALQFLDASQAQDALVLDLSLPDGAGEQLLHKLRKSRSAMAIIVISAHSGLDVRLNALRQGADDFLVKPFDINEMIVRLQAIDRRRSGFSSTVWRLGSVCIDTDAKQVWRDGKQVSLSPSEFNLLHEMVRKSGRVMVRDHLMSYLRCESFNALEVHIHNLRSKLGADWIRTVRGVGYMVSSQKEDISKHHDDLIMHCS